MLELVILGPVLSGCGAFGFEEGLGSDWGVFELGWEVSGELGWEASG